jgi:hypothetical protein
VTGEVGDVHVTPMAEAGTLGSIVLFGIGKIRL